MYNPKLFPEVEKIRRQKIKAARVKEYGHRLYRNKDWLREQYVVKRKYLKIIAREANAVDSTILLWIRKFGFPIISLSERHKENPSLYKRFLKASRIVNRPTGEKHWKYQPISMRKGLSQLYNSVDYDIWKEAVHKRDNYTCKGCNARPKILCAHHILPVRDFRNLVYAIDNGISLCVSCHSKTCGIEYRFVALYKKLVNSGKPKAKSQGNPEPSPDGEGVETRHESRKAKG